VKYLVIYEWADTNWSAYAPDIPGCVATGATKDEVRREMREALAFHFQGMRYDGEPLPESKAWAENVEIDVPVAS